MATARVELDGPQTVAAIPHTLSDYACLDLANSRFNDHTGTGEVYDRLPMPAWQQWFAERCNVPEAGPPTASSLRALTGLRDLVRQLLESRRAPDRTALAEVNRYLAGPAQRWELARAGGTWDLRLAWDREDWTAVMAATMASYADLLVNGTLERVRVCGNPACTWLFFDESRNGTRRWCDPAVCGNLVKVRRHRAQRRTVHA